MFYRYRLKLAIIGLLAATLYGCGSVKGVSKDGGKTCRCDMPQLGLASNYLPVNQTYLSGHLRLSSLPLSLEGAEFFLYVDELSVYSDKPVRIIEQEFAVEPPQDNTLVCGNGSFEDDQIYGDDQVYEEQECTCEIYLTTQSDQANQAQIEPISRSEGHIYIDAESVGPIPFDVILTYPDQRSLYSVGFLVDLDGSGKLTDGDYATTSMLPVNHLSGANDLLVDLQRYEEILTPDPDPTPEPSAEPSAEPSPEPTLEPTPEPTPE